MNMLATIANHAANKSFVLVKEEERLLFVNLQEVPLVECAKGAIFLQHRGRKLRVKPKEAGLNQRLDPDWFFQASDNIFINMHFIETVETRYNKQLQVRLRGYESPVLFTVEQSRAFMEAKRL